MTIIILGGVCVFIFFVIMFVAAYVVQLKYETGRAEEEMLGPIKHNEDDYDGQPNPLDDLPSD